MLSRITKSNLVSGLHKNYVKNQEGGHAHQFLAGPSSTHLTTFTYPGVSCNESWPLWCTSEFGIRRSHAPPLVRRFQACKTHSHPPTNTWNLTFRGVWFRTVLPLKGPTAANVRFHVPRLLRSGSVNRPPPWRERSLSKGRARHRSAREFVAPPLEGIACCLLYYY